MKTTTQSRGSYALIYDTACGGVTSPEYFSVDAWRAKNAVEGEAVGRGSAWFLNTADGPMVLRRYLRGGWAAKVSHRRYLFSGVTRSRPFREYYLLEALSQLGLPVPRPVAAICEFSGLTYTGAIVTATIPSAQTLADLLPSANDRTWEAAGRCIRRFHDAGVRHADLNARNILIGERGRVYLVDFDRAKYSPEKPLDGRGNLKRLKRSLLKFWPADEQAGLQQAWERLMEAYDGR
jgi:3-deoxy-D-manno-octulosonic acid kinase